MDELIDILDSEGNHTGKAAQKSYAHRMGLFHATVHIWFYTKDGKILIQQRGKEKSTYPLFWDVSVAGHVGANEAIEIAAIREVEEEIGIRITKDNLEKIGVFKSIQKHNEDFIDCEFHYTYLCELKVPLSRLQKQESEIEALDLIPLYKFAIEIQNKITSKKYVPHGTTYFSTIIKTVKKKSS